MHFDKRKSGISFIDDLPWGSHFCQFYQTKKDLLDILVPYFRAGLENNELCVWVTPENLSSDDAEKALRKAVPHFDDYAKRDQMEIIPAGLWPTGGGKSGRAVISKVDNAAARGFDGLRLACNAIPEREDGKAFSTYVTDAVSRYNAIAVFAYPRDDFDAIGLMEVVKNHRFALVRNAGRWEVIESSEARTVKDALKRSEEKLQSLFSNMSEGFAYHRVVLDAGGKPCDYIFLEVNKAFERLTALNGKTVIGKRATEVLPGIENDPTDWIGKYGNVAMTGTPLHFESYSESLERWYSVSAFSPHKGYFAMTVSDITGRKQGEEALRRSNVTLELLAESARLLLTSETPERIVRTICEKVMHHLDCDAFFNYLVQEGRQRMRLNASAGVPEETAKEIEWLDFGVAVCGCVARDGCRIIAEDIPNTPDDRTVLVRSFGIQAYACHPLIYQGRTIGTLSFGTRNRAHFSHEEVELMKAVTDLVATAMARKRAEESLIRAKEEWELTFDSVPDMIAIIDNRHRIMRVNEAMALRFGLKVEECVGLPCYQYVHGLSGPPPFCPHSRTICDGSQHFEEIHESNLGGCFLVSTTPLRGRQGQMIGSVHVAHDITERKKAEERIMSLNEQLRRNIEELSSANKEIEAFSYSVSHDLRSPLRSIDGFSQELLEDYSDKLDENGRDSLRRIRAASQRMGLLIDGLLMLSRISRSELTHEPVNLSAVARDVARVLQETQPEREAEFVISEGLFAEGDERLLYATLQNLLGNAWKFTGKSGKSRIEFGASRVDGRPVYFVRDNGAGFDMAFADKLFRPFQRLHDAADFSGTGIGLATVQRIIHRHGGRVWAEGKVGKGATFYFTLKHTQ
ncbi:MAG: MEDS domain-containing protein [Nitrospirae bacterium]|nr:MEDS domain-containing protein [Nitrospirota bacterium]